MNTSILQFSVQLVSILLICGLSAVATAAEIHVPADQPTIQAGLDAAVSGDIVIVADGTWAGPGNRDLLFNGKAVTVRSANGPENCTIDAGGSEAEPHRAFDCQAGETPQSVIDGFTLIGGYADRGGAIICYTSSPTIRNCVIRGNTAERRGGGISCHYSASPEIIGCEIKSNIALGGDTRYGGGGVSLIHQCDVLMEDCLVEGNSGWYGGGIKNRSGGNIQLENCIFSDNEAERGGGYVGLSYSDATMTNCLFVGNRAGDQGGGIFLYSDYGEPRPRGGSPSSTSLQFCTMARNTAPGSGGAIDGSHWWGADAVALSNSIVWDCGADPVEAHYLTITWSDVEGWTGGGGGNIDADPLFVTGPLGDHYLSQTAAGQAEQSPCVDAGDSAVSAPDGTTRTDGVADTGAPDMGYHHEPATWAGLVITGPGPGPDNPPLVRAFPPEQDATRISQFTAYGAPSFGVKVACGDVDGDGADEIITGAGPGAIYGPHVRGFDPPGNPLPGLSYLAYGTHKWGVNAACGDTDGDGYDEIITGAGPGVVFGPHVRGWNYDGGTGVTAIPDISYFAYGTLEWGVNVASGDIDGDGYDEIVTGAGPGLIFGPHVRGWDVDGGPVAPMGAVSYMAYGTFRYGVNVCCGDVDGDGIDEIITAPGPSPAFGADIRGWNFDGGAIEPLPDFAFFAWPGSEARYGARVDAGADLDGDGRDDLLVGAGPDPGLGTPLRAYRYDGSTVSFWFSFDAYETGVTHGVNVAGGRF